jgi:hypothetical protein
MGTTSGVVLCCLQSGATRLQTLVCEPLDTPLAAVHESAHGRSRHLAAARQFGRFRAKADIGPDFMSARPDL